MFHELTHVPWTLSLPGAFDKKATVDFIGYYDSAVYADSKSGKNRKADWRNMQRNADNYAWYMLYRYWNGKDGTNGCQNDVWPPPPAKKKPNPVAF